MNRLLDGIVQSRPIARGRQLLADTAGGRPHFHPDRFDDLTPEEVTALGPADVALLARVRRALADVASTLYGICQRCGDLLDAEEISEAPDMSWVLPLRATGEQLDNERRQLMNVGQLMNKVVETCRLDDNLATAAGKMWDRDIGCLPVMGPEGRLAGIVTDRDVCMAGYIQGRPLAEVPVRVAMSKTLYTCRPEDAVIAAEEAMRFHQVRRLPVVDASGALVGIVSLNDLAREAERQVGRKGRELTSQEVSATLAAVCAPRNGRALTATV